MCSVATTPTFSPSSRAVSAVIGPMAATSDRSRPDRSPPSAATRLRAVLELVSVTMSIAPWRTSRSVAGSASVSGTVR